LLGGTKAVALPVPAPACSSCIAYAFIINQAFTNGPNNAVNRPSKTTAELGVYPGLEICSEKNRFLGI